MCYKKADRGYKNCKLKSKNLIKALKDQIYKFHLQL